METLDVEDLKPSHQLFDVPIQITKKKTAWLYMGVHTQKSTL